jgi:phenylacetate-CoA ligase
MNPLLNPLVSLPFIKNYIADPQRHETLTPTKLQHYRDNAVQHILHYAYTVPLYKTKYDQAGIQLKKIRTIHDIEKLPFLSKKELTDNFPENLIPTTYNKKKGHIVSTGGTTGKPVSIYTDFPTMLRALGPVLAQMRYFKLSPRKTKIAHLGNFNRYRIDAVSQEHFLPHLKHLVAINNVLNIDVNAPIKTMMEQLDTFQPDLIISYPPIFQHLAYLKKKGYGEHVHPKLLQVGGEILDEYTRRYVEDAFSCRLLNIYLSVEAQACIAFECNENNWHIHSDFFHVEAIDKEEHLVAPGEKGHIVITRLWGKGTPIIRYTGMDDWITLSDHETCSCGLKSPILKTPVEGRMKANIILPNGKIFPPGAFCFISPVLHDLKTYKVKQFQVIQKKINAVEIHLVIDEDLRNVGASVDQIKNEIQKIYQQKTGPEVHITVKEVSEIKGDPISGKPPPIVISHVKPDAGYKIIER